MKKVIKYLLILWFVNQCTTILADNEIFEAEISIKDHKFHPENLEVPQKVKIRLTVKNLDDTIEEFDSIDLRREKIIPGHGQVHIVLAPLKPGIYNFVGEFHHETAKGCIVVK
ncbi:MAG: cupredoxin domain-containing protein [Rickettsiaceae bacterium]|nr:MAG: cupredoxin domain-containing protein [Rickettsiaceae bacterium]